MTENLWTTKVIPNDRATFSESYTEIQVTKMFGQKNNKAFGVFLPKMFDTWILL